MLQAMGDLERTWNSKFNYPWTFFNDVPFTEEFKKKTSAATKAQCFYGEIIYLLLETLADIGFRIDSKRALGRPIVDQRGNLPRICKDTEGERYSVWCHEILPSNVSVEQWFILQAPSSRTYTILLASRAKGTLLLRCRLRCIPIYARLQQDLWFHDQPLRCSTINTIIMARDDKVHGTTSRISAREPCDAVVD